MKKLLAITIAYIALCVAGMWVLTQLGFSGDYFAAASTATVGYLAYVVYELGKLNQAIDAAKIVILEIRSAESALLSLRTEQTMSAWTKVVMGENNWTRYRQLFVSILNSDEFQHFDRFFHNWSQLVLWKTQTETFGRVQLEAKAAKVQELLLELTPGPDFDMRRSTIIARADSETWMFDPNMLNVHIQMFLTSLEPMTGTSGFAKLRKYARLPE